MKTKKHREMRGFSINRQTWLNIKQFDRNREIRPDLKADLLNEAKKAKTEAEFDPAGLDSSEWQPN